MIELNSQHFPMFLFVIFISIRSVASGPCQAPPLSKGKAIICSIANGQTVACDQRQSVPEETVAQYFCKKFYFHSLEDSVAKTMTCGASGQWDRIADFSSLSCSLACGHNFFVTRQDSLVVNGQTNGQTFWPWYAAIFRITTDGTISFQCGGSLINPWAKGFAILTTAHCVTDPSGKMYPFRDFSIVLGGRTTRFDLELENSHAATYLVQDIYIHPDFSRGNGFNADIALIHLTKEVELTDYVLPGCLPTFEIAESQLILGNMGTIVGFSQNQFGDYTSRWTGPAKFSPTSLNDCKLTQQTIRSGVFCARFASNTEPSICGDSASGLGFNQISPEKFFIQGLITNTSNCGKPGQRPPILFTRVSYYVTWIRDKLDEHQTKFPQDNWSPTYKPQQTIVTTQRPRLTTARNVIPVVAPTSVSSIPEIKNTQFSLEDFSPNAGGPPELINLSQGDILSLTSSSGGVSGYVRHALAYHNFYRRFHQANPLVFNQTLSAAAQASASQIVTQGQSIEIQQPNNPYNPNLYQIVGKVDAVTAVRIATGKLYRDRINYRFGEPSSFNNAFAFIVWKRTSSLGVGVATQRGRTVIVFNYWPPGNEHYRRRDGSIDYSSFKENVSS